LQIKSVGLIVNKSKVQALEFAHEVIAFLTERDVGVCVDLDCAPLLGRDDIAVPEVNLAKVDLLITLGGDGTILQASHIAAPAGIPILGVHMGQFGFIAESHPGDLFPNLDELLEGKVEIEERMMVNGEVFRDGESVCQANGLNDIVLTKGLRARMLRLQTSFGEEFVSTYPADGVIVATPTGSTGYALSAGGPLVEPTVQALLVVPICAHSLAARPLVIPCDEVVSIVIESDGGEVLFSADGAAEFALESGDKVVAKKADFSARFITFRNASFYRKVHKRLLWAERLNA
jgi:NAD+ kinase